MTTKKTISKVSRKASVDVDINLNKKTTNKIKRHIKKTPLKVLLVAFLVMLIGVGVGFFTTKFLTRNDCFELNGQESKVMSVGETYKDEGCKIISFGKDISNNVVVETDLLLNEDGEYYTNEEGVHYIKYTVKSIKYGTIFKIQKIRTFVFEVSESGE